MNDSDIISYAAFVLSGLELSDAAKVLGMAREDFVVRAMDYAASNKLPYAVRSSERLERIPADVYAALVRFYREVALFTRTGDGGWIETVLDRRRGLLYEVEALAERENFGRKEILARSLVDGRERWVERARGSPVCKCPDDCACGHRDTVATSRAKSPHPTTGASPAGCP